MTWSKLLLGLGKIEIARNAGTLGRGCCTPFSLPGDESEVAGLDQHLLERGGFSLKAFVVGIIGDR